MQKSLFVLVLFLSSTILSQAQDRIKEVGLSFRSLDYFGVLYKVGRADALWRFNSAYVSGSDQKDAWTSSNIDYHNKGFSVGFQVGREFRKPIAEKLQFKYGFDASFNYASSSTEFLYVNSYDNYEETSKVFIPGLNGVVGLNYFITERLLLGAEISPGISYKTGKSTLVFEDDRVDVHKDVSGVSFSASISSAMLTLSYQFIK